MEPEVVAGDLPGELPAGSPGWVLVADDTESIRYLIRVNLELEGFVVVDRSDGDSAVALVGLAARTGRLPAVVVVDAQMGPGDGWSVVQRLRAMPETASVPVVMATAAIQDHERKRAVATGVDAFVAKPFDPEALVELVVTLARDGRQADTRPGP